MYSQYVVSTWYMYGFIGIDLYEGRFEKKQPYNLVLELYSVCSLRKYGSPLMAIDLCVYGIGLLNIVTLWILIVLCLSTEKESTFLYLQ